MILLVQGDSHRRFNIEVQTKEEADALNLLLKGKEFASVKITDASATDSDYCKDTPKSEPLFTEDDCATEEKDCRCRGKYHWRSSSVTSSFVVPPVRYRYEYIPTIWTWGTPGTVTYTTKACCCSNPECQRSGCQNYSIL